MLLAPWVLAHASVVQAEPVGSPSSILKKGQWVLGLNAGGLERDVKKSSLHAKALLIQVGHVRGYGLTDWLSLYAAVGGAYLRVKNGGTSDSFDANLLLSGQVKTKLWESKRWGSEWDASTQYVYVGRPHRRRGNQAHWNEWQFATSVAKSFGRIKPYVGAKVSLVNLNFKIRKDTRTTQEGTYAADGVVSPFAGFDLYLSDTESLVINVESSFVNRGEVDMVVAYRF